MTDYETKDSGERQYWPSGMQRDVTEGKLKWHLVASGPMLERWAGLMTRGADKYDDDNWMKASSPEERERFRASAFRHFMQWYNGDTDEDHAAAVVFNINGAEYVNGQIEGDGAGTGQVRSEVQSWQERRANDKLSALDDAQPRGQEPVSESEPRQRGNVLYGMWSAGRWIQRYHGNR